MEQETVLLHLEDVAFGSFIEKQKCLDENKTSKFTQLLPNKMIEEQRAGKKNVPWLLPVKMYASCLLLVRETALVESQAHVAHNSQFSKAHVLGKIKMWGYLF